MSLRPHPSSSATPTPVLGASIDRPCEHCDELGDCDCDLTLAHIELVLDAYDRIDDDDSFLHFLNVCDPNHPELRPELIGPKINININPKKWTKSFGAWRQKRKQNHAEKSRKKNSFANLKSAFDGLYGKSKQLKKKLDRLYGGSSGFARGWKRFKSMADLSFTTGRSGKLKNDAGRTANDSRIDAANKYDALAKKISEATYAISLAISAWDQFKYDNAKAETPGGQ